MRGYKLYRGLVTRDGTLLPPDTALVVLEDRGSVCICRVTPKNSPRFDCEIDTAAVKAAFPNDEDDRAVGHDEMHEWIYGNGEHPLSPTAARRRMRNRIESDVRDGWDILERGEASVRLYRRRRWSSNDTAMVGFMAVATFGLAVPKVVGDYLKQPEVRYRNYKIAENGELLVWHEPPVLNDSPPPSSLG